jgi:hypothetical protein
MSPDKRSPVDPCQELNILLSEYRYLESLPSGFFETLLHQYKNRPLRTSCITLILMAISWCGYYFLIKESTMLTLSVHIVITVIWLQVVTAYLLQRFYSREKNRATHLREEILSELRLSMGAKSSKLPATIYKNLMTLTGIVEVLTPRVGETEKKRLIQSMRVLYNMEQQAEEANTLKTQIRTLVDELTGKLILLQGVAVGAFGRKNTSEEIEQLTRQLDDFANSLYH